MLSLWWRGLFLATEGKGITNLFLNLVKAPRLDDNAGVFNKLCDSPVFTVLNANSKRIAESPIPDVPSLMAPALSAVFPGSSAGVITSFTGK